MARLLLLTVKVARMVFVIMVLCGIGPAAPRAWAQTRSYLSDQGRTQAIAELDAARARDTEALSAHGVTAAEPAADVDRQRHRQAPAGRDDDPVGLLVQEHDRSDHAVAKQDQERSPEELADEDSTERR